MKAKVNKITVQIVEGDIYRLPVAGIVTVTDPNLTVDPALLALTGADVAHETRQIAWADVGSAVITSAGRLENAQKIIHAVGPRWSDDNPRARLVRVTWNCLELAEEHELKSIALPPVSVGTLGYPLESCANVMIEQIIDYSFEKPRHLKTIVICVDQTPNALGIFQDELRRQLEELRESGEGHVHV